jgi:hypothetical protein
MAEIKLRQRSDTPAAVADVGVLFFDTSGNLNIRRPDGVILTFAASATATATIPESGVVALRNKANTFDLAQTFTTRPVAGGITSPSNSTASIVLTNATGTPILTVDSTNNRVITAGDVFANADTSGLMTRIVNVHQTPTDHFTATTLAAGWSWAGSPFADTPDNVSLTAIPSLLRVYDSVLTDNFFLAQSASASVFGRVFVSGNSYVGVRLDDGSTDNSIEVRVQGSATGLVSVTALLVNGGGSPTSTTLLSNMMAQWFTLRVTRSGATVGTYWGVNAPVPTYAYGAGSQTWTATRGGIVFGQRVAPFSLDLAAGYIDWVAIS